MFLYACFATAEPKYSPLAIQHAHEGEDLSIYLNLVAYPFPQRQHCTLTREGGGQLSPLVSFEADVITFMSVTREATGTYILMAENELGKGHVTITLEVLCTYNNIMINGRNTLISLPCIHLLSAHPYTNATTVFFLRRPCLLLFA